MQKDEERNLQSQLATMTHFFNLKNVLSLWPTLNYLKIEFLSEIHMIMAIRPVVNNTYRDVFIIVKKDGNVYSYGHKSHQNSSESEHFLSLSKTMDTLPDDGNPEIIENLCGINIKTFIQIDTHGLFALTHEGKVYSWGDNRLYTLGHKEAKIISKPTLVTSLSNINIVNIVCGRYHALALTADGKVYTWGKNIEGSGEEADWQPSKQISKLEKKKIVSIACGLTYSIVVTDNGEVYNWGSLFNTGNVYDGSLAPKKPCTKFNIDKKVVKQMDITVKVACGSNHALALTDRGNLYVWGENSCGQLGKDINNYCDIYIKDPILLNTADMGELSDIAASSMKDISVAVNKNGCFYVWGLYAEVKILKPHAIIHTNMYDVFASMNIMYKPLILSEGHEYVKKESNIIRCLKDAFNDSSISDFKIQVEGRDIHVHKAILKICSLHFRTMFQHNWTENTENVLKLDMFSYNVYEAYFKYLYTSEIEIPPEEALEFLKLADMYGETNLKTDCIPIIQREITISNVALFYSAAIEYNEQRLEEFCFSFILGNMTKVIQTENFIKLDENKKTMFLIKAAKANAFKT